MMSVRHRLVKVSAVVLTITGPSCRSSVPELNLRVRQSRGDLLVTNNESAAVWECLLQINDGFEVRNLTLPASEAVRVPLRRFTKRDGLRFNEATHEVRTILVQCFQPTMRVASFGAT
jgi:hypothetical protein